MSWRDLLRKHSDDADDDRHPMDPVLENRGHDVSRDARRFYELIELEGGCASDTDLYDSHPDGAPIGWDLYWYSFLHPFFRNEVPDDVVRQVGGITVDAEAAVDAGYLELNRHGSRYNVTDAFEAHAVELIDSTARLSGKEETGFWTLQRAYRYLADNAPMHEFDLLYEVREGLRPIIQHSSNYPNWLLLNGRHYRDYLAEREWGDYEVARYDLLPELPGVVDAGELYLVTPEGEDKVPDGATEPAEVPADA